MLVMGVPKFERCFRAAAGLDVDKDDLKRYSDFIHSKIYDLLLMAQVRAKADGRDIIEPSDLPITKGLQECIHHFEKLEEAIELEPILARLAEAPQLDMALSEEANDRLPLVAGGLSVGLARLFTIIDTKLVNPSSEHWERAFQVCNLLL